jgi:SRSO17 transposase
VLGLLAAGPRVNCWTIAEHAGDVSPAGMQHLLSRTSWDADGVRDDIRGYVAEHLGSPDAVLVVDLCRSWNYAEARAAGRERALAWRSDRVCRAGGPA